MGFKKVISLLLVISFVVVTALTGCGNTVSDNKDAAAAQTPADSGNKTDSGSKTEGGDTAAISHDKQLTIDIYDVAANYQDFKADGLTRLLRTDLILRLTFWHLR
jgi:uncharacterized protein YceK